MSTYATTKLPAPLYNTPNFPHFQSKFERDHQGLLKSVEVIILPGTKLTVIKKVALHVCEIKTVDYSSSTPLYIDSRFFEQASKETPEREKHLPLPAEIITFLRSTVGVRYFWGGNWAEGIPEMSHFYPQFTSTEDQDDVICKGMDCSGLLYQATNGFTPRNTTQLCRYGQELQIDQNSPSAVQQVVKPLDMMVWKGHVIFALDSDHVIESVVGRGVIISDFIERYSFFLNKLRAEKQPFFLRRWHPHFLT
ncbi:MAG: hypothetical protein ACRDF4_11055 [Rhabdochlamydiaceae bacterium]